MFVVGGYDVDLESNSTQTYSTMCGTGQNLPCVTRHRSTKAHDGRQLQPYSLFVAQVATFKTGSPTKVLYAFVVFRIQATCPTHHNFLDSATLTLQHRVQNGSGAHPASYPMGTRGSFPGVKLAWE
jgi:hypothetical protein